MKAESPSLPGPLAGRSIALIFERESLRTRVAFEVGIAQLGGHPIFLQQETIGLATRESVNDIGRVLSGYCAAIVARTTKHQTCVQLAESAGVPVVNAMTDLVHPCQVLADAMTLRKPGGSARRSRSPTSAMATIWPIRGLSWPRNSH
jgi:ornithine carbamoyltransferase